MSLPRLATGLAAGLLALGLGITAASAATAFASTSVNVRAGAGTGYRVVDVLHPGEQVEVDYCRGTWCYVTKPGPDGWVSASYLEADSYDDDDYYDDDRDYFFIERPQYRHRHVYPRFRSEVCWGGGKASFCFY